MKKKELEAELEWFVNLAQSHRYTIECLRRDNSILQTEVRQLKKNMQSSCELHQQQLQNSERKRRGLRKRVTRLEAEARKKNKLIAVLRYKATPTCKDCDHFGPYLNCEPGDQNAIGVCRRRTIKVFESEPTCTMFKAKPNDVEPEERTCRNCEHWSEDKLKWTNARVCSALRTFTHEKPNCKHWAKKETP